jgi:hypothetical protein
MSMDLSDLESRLFEEPKSASKAKKAKPVKKEKPAKAAPSPTLVAASPKATATSYYDIEPKKSKKELKEEKKEKAAREKAAPKPTVEKPVKEKKEKAIKVPKISIPKPAPVAKAPKESVGDTNVAAGVALGAAPLVALPLIALGAGRNVLSGTKDRREKIQAEIEEYEREEKAKNQAEVDAGGLVGALVSFINMVVKR